MCFVHSSSKWEQKEKHNQSQTHYLAAPSSPPPLPLSPPPLADMHANTISAFTCSRVQRLFLALSSYQFFLVFFLKHCTNEKPCLSLCVGGFKAARSTLFGFCLESKNFRWAPGKNSCSAVVTVSKDGRKEGRKELEIHEIHLYPTVWWFQTVMENWPWKKKSLTKYQFKLLISFLSKKEKEKKSIFFCH